MKVAKWEDYQGYKKKGPPWLKLHASIIDTPAWMRLPLVAKAVLPYLWIAASRSGSDGELPDESDVLAMLCHMKESEVSEALPFLVEAGFLVCDKAVAESATKLSQGVRQDFRLGRGEREGETEAEGKRETENGTPDHGRSVDLRKGAPNETPVSLTPSAKQTDEPAAETAPKPKNGSPWSPQSLGILTNPADFCHQELAHATVRFVKSLDPPDPKACAARLLRDCSLTSGGKEINSSDIRRVTKQWAKVTLDRMYKLAAEEYGFDLAPEPVPFVPFISAPSSDPPLAPLQIGPNVTAIREGRERMTARASTGISEGDGPERDDDKARAFVAANGGLKALCADLRDLDYGSQWKRRLAEILSELEAPDEFTGYIEARLIESRTDWTQQAQERGRAPSCAQETRRLA